MRNYRGIPIGGKDFFVYGWYFERAGGSYIIPITDKYHTPASFVLTFVPVIPESVGQATGLKDKNGKESYDGDKLKDTLADVGIIHWEENVAGFYVKWGDGSDLPINTFVAVNKCEIFGNVHQPELMEKSK